MYGEEESIMTSGLRRPAANQLPWNWGATTDERSEDFPCAEQLDEPVRTLYRAVSVAGSAQLTYAWLCQIKVAPYSYDLLDNLGRRSPPELTAGLTVAEGDRMMVFRCVQLGPGLEWTGVGLAGPGRIFGPMAVTYRAKPLPGGGSRLICRLDVAIGSGPAERVRSWALAWGDLVMMRKQLLTLKTYAERDALRAVDPACDDRAARSRRW